MTGRSSSLFQKIVRRIEAVPTDNQSRPKSPVKIVNSGILALNRPFEVAMTSV
jgi:hypothetical protein